MALGLGSEAVSRTPSRACEIRLVHLPSSEVLCRVRLKVGKEHSDSDSDSVLLNALLFCNLEIKRYVVLYNLSNNVLKITNV